jgi:hypothetical protein
LPEKLPALAGRVVTLAAAGVALAQGQASAADSIDTTPPTVTSTIPTPGTTCVDPAANVSAFFSEDMRASSINGTTVNLHRKDSATRVDASVRYGATKARAIIDPAYTLEGGVAYKAVVTTYVKDLAGNRLDQDSSLTGLQRKAWVFTTSADSVTPLECMQVAAQSDLRNASVAANACAAGNNGSYVNCATVARLQPYGFDQTAGVTVNGMNGNDVDWSAAMQHESGGSAYTFATFGDNAGQVTQAPRGTDAPPLPDRIAEWEALAKTDTRNAATAATAYAADNNGSYTGITLFALEVHGFVQSPGVTTTVTASSGGDQVIIVSEHASGGRAYQYDSATGEIVPIPR